MLYYRYEAGDHVAVYPVNESEIVEGIGKRLEIDLDKVFTLTNVDGMLLFICIITFSYDCKHFIVMIWYGEGQPPHTSMAL